MRAVLALLASVLAILVACGRGDREAPSVAVPGHAGALKTAAAQRAERRAYDGAPPIIPHAPFGADCMSCHTQSGLAVEDLGFAPAMPHDFTRGLSAIANCKQCHVYRATDELFVQSTFEGRPQDLRGGARWHELAPPVLPHPTFMRENCLACHAGPGAREEIRTTHPERANCLQCHVAQHAESSFRRP